MTRSKQWITLVLLALATICVAFFLRDCSTDPCTQPHWKLFFIPAILIGVAAVALLRTEKPSDTSVKPETPYDVRMGTPGSWGSGTAPLQPPARPYVPPRPSAPPPPPTDTAP